MKYEIDSRVRYSEMGSKSYISLPGIINYFQDTSTFQSDALGVGVDELQKRNRAWILSSWQVVVDRYPSFGEEIKVATWATDFTGVCGTRNFLLTGADGIAAAYANSIWAYMDLKRGRPVKPDQMEIDRYGIETALEMEYAPRKIVPLSVYQECAAFPVRRDHIDTNGHVNNCQYVQMGLNALEEEMKVRQVRVEYKIPAVLGDIIYPRIATDSERIVVELCNQKTKPYAIIELIGE